jgi:predicted amidohydrolase YtcJ
MVNITDTSEVPIGGVIDRFPNGTITGVCRESAVLPLVGAFSMSFGKLNSTQVQAGVDAYLSCGVTTVHDMLIS